MAKSDLVLGEFPATRIELDERQVLKITAKGDASSFRRQYYLAAKRFLKGY